LSQPLRVAAVGITPPGVRASGGISAGIQLMCRVAELCETSMYLMSDRDEDRSEGRLRLCLRRATNVLRPVAHCVPRVVTTLAWRANIAAWLGELRPDIVHLHNPHPPGAMLQVARSCARLGIPYVISTHGFVELNDFSRGYGSPRWQRPLLERYVRRPLVEAARAAARIAMLSPFEEPILAAMGVPASRLALVPNGVDPYFLEALTPQERGRLVARFALPRDRPSLLFVGNHTANKGLDVLLRALALMQQRCVAVIAGAIRSAHETRALIAASGLAPGDSRFMFTDFLSREELRALYQSVDAFVFPSRADTLPLVILEAMASSLPVVASRVGGIPFEVSEDTGVLVPPGDAPGLDRICASAELRERLGRQGRLRVVEHFNWSTAARAAVALYREILGVTEKQTAAG
jgi:alpha-maltose-1-phosphate synthase